MKDETTLILIADDSDDIRMLYTEALTAAGLRVIAATTGEEAVTKALAEHPAVILMDIMMPDMNGHEAVEKIRQDPWGKTARIIYLTNLTEPENVVKAFDNEPEDYIVKVHTEPKEVVNLVRIASHKRS